MKKVPAVLTALAVSCFGFTVFAAEGDAPTVKGNIEIYGAAKLSVDLIDTGNKTTGADKNLNKVYSNSSRLGFKGSEDLGDGLSAVYQLELGVNMDGTTQKTVESISSATTNTTTGVTTIKTKDANVNTLGLRNTYVGLKHNSFGTVLLGTHDTPYKISTLQFDPFGDSMGDYNAIIGNVNGDANFDLRPKDVIAYASPTWGGVQVSAAVVQTGQETNNGTDSNSNAYSASALYNAGPLAVALAYEIHKNGVNAWDGGSAASPGGTTVTGAKLGAGYTFGGTKVGLVYESLKSDKVNSPFSRNAMYFSATQTIGKEKIKLAFGKADDGEDPATKTGATMMAVGVDHAFSKRTSVYALYAATKNDKDATYGLGQSGAGGAYVPGKGEDPSVVSFGINHSF